MQSLGLPKNYNSMKQKLTNLIKGSFLVDEKSSSNWIYIFLFLILSIIMISSSHSTDIKVFRIAELNEEIKSLKSEFVETRTTLIRYKMESSIKRRLADQGIKPSTIPPVKIKINVSN